MKKFHVFLVILLITGCIAKEPKPICPEGECKGDPIIFSVSQWNQTNTSLLVVNGFRMAFNGVNFRPNGTVIYYSSTMISTNMLVLGSFRLIDDLNVVYGLIKISPGVRLNGIEVGAMSFEPRRGNGASQLHIQFVPNSGSTVDVLFATLHSAKYPDDINSYYGHSNKTVYVLSSYTVAGYGVGGKDTENISISGTIYNMQVSAKFEVKTYLNGSQLPSIGSTQLISNPYPGPGGAASQGALPQGVPSLMPGSVYP